MTGTAFGILTEGLRVRLCVFCRAFPDLPCPHHRSRQEPTMDDIAPGELRRTPGPTFTPIPDPPEETDPLRAAIRNALGPHARHLELRGEDDKWRPAVDVLEAALRPLVPAGADVDPHAVDLADVPEDRIRKADQ